MFYTPAPIPIRITADEVIGYLYPDCHRIPAHIRQRSANRSNPALGPIVDTVNETIVPRGCMRIVTDLHEWSELSQFELAAVALVTLGNTFDSMLENTALSMVETILMDAAGTAMLDKACNYVDDCISGILKKRKVPRSPRFSPGYGRLPLANQRHCFRILPAAAMDVSLSETFMMRPLKSVTYIVLPFYPGDPPVRDNIHCSACGHTNCSYRNQLPEEE